MSDRQRDRGIDDILRQAAAAAQQDVDTAMLDRISASLGSDLQPVRPLPALWVMWTALWLVCVGVAGVAAALLGMNGIVRMSVTERIVIFGALATLVWLAGTLCVAETVPGSRRPLAAWVLALTACVGLAAVFALLFQDYRTEAFVREGFRCLRAGVGLSTATSVGIWWILRRGFVVDRAAAGLGGGTLAGLAGVLMLELHCPILEAPHLMVWHVGTIVVAGATGWILGGLWGRR